MVHDDSIKMQPQWLDATYQALSNKESNLQLGIGARFSYEHCSGVNSPEILDYIAKTWIACKPIITKMLR